MSNFETIAKLAQTNPIVRQGLQLQQAEGVPYDQALEFMVISLCQVNAEQNKMLLDFHRWGSPAPMIITTTPDEAQRISEMLRPTCISEDNPDIAYRIFNKGPKPTKQERDLIIADLHGLTGGFPPSQDYAFNCPMSRQEGESPHAYEKRITHSPYKGYDIPVRVVHAAPSLPTAKEVILTKVGTQWPQGYAYAVINHLPGKWSIEFTDAKPTFHPMMRWVFQTPNILTYPGRPCTDWETTIVTYEEWSNKQ